MKLIFGLVEEDFSEEIKKALGFIDHDVPFIKMKPDLRTVTSKLIRFIGKETYADLSLIYENHEDAPAETTAGDNANLLELAQSYVATAAYRLFAPVNDLQHGKNGRKMLTDEDSKTPFEHMLVASNDELERRSFRAMDDLLYILDEISTTWKGSDNYKATHRLFVRTTDDFDTFHVMGSRLLLLKLQPDMEYVETRQILPRIGKDVFDALKQKLNGTATDALSDKEKDLLPLLKEAAVNGSLSRGVIRLQGTLFPEGLLQQTRVDRATIKSRMGFIGNQVDQASQFFSQTADRVLKDIEAVITSYAPVVETDTEETATDNSCTSDDKFMD